MQNIFRKKYLYKNFLYLNYFIEKFIMAGISNQNLLNFAEGKTNDDIKKKFVGVFPSNFITKFITFHRMMNEKGTRYPFIIMNTDCSNKKGTHWWSFLDLHSKKEIFLFDSFGFDGFKDFFLQDVKKTLNKIIYRIKKFEAAKKDSKITVITLTFSMEEYKKLKTLNRLSETTQDILHFMNKFGKLYNLKEVVREHFADDQLQKTETDTCGVFKFIFL